MRTGVSFALIFLVLTCGAEHDTSIMRIQGAGSRSPLVGQIVTTSGIVTAVRLDRRGFWLQDPEGDADVETSDGILVWTEEAAAVGDRVRARGTVAEFAREGDRSLTQIEDIEQLEVVSSGHTLPEAYRLPLLPDTSVTDAIAYWSRLEGMRVRFGVARVVGPTNPFGEIVVVLEAQAPEGDHVFVRPVMPAGDGEVDYNPERILIDDATRDAVEARPGDRVRDLVGVVDYSFGNYKLQPTELRHEAGSREPFAPRATTGSIAVASFNVENLFDDDPVELETKLSDLSRFIREMLIVPEILVVQEVENEEVLQLLADRINVQSGTSLRVEDTRYRARGLGSSDGRGIENAFLYDASRVDLDEALLLAGPEVDAAFGPGSASPGREPLVGRFDIGGIELAVIGNHFKSKGGDDPLFGARQPFQRPTEEQRKLQARVVRDFVDSLLDERPEALILVAGDFNDFPFAEPGEGPVHPLGVLAGDDFTNVVAELPSPYTYIFDGNAQVLDHVLVSPALAELVVGTEIVHGNADVPESPSDHDVPVVRLQLR